MTIDEVITYFGNLNQACIALGIAAQNMTKWKRQGYIPLLQQYRIAELTEGLLMPQEDDPKVKPNKRKGR
jgi:predicted site-specific integrase-resolvase